jgi:hypothetical protein
MSRKLSDQEFHALYCPVKNPKSALFLVAFFSLETFISWKGLHKPPEHPDLFSLFFLILVMALLAKPLLTFTCFRERLVFGLVIVSVATDEGERFVPSVFGQHADTVKLVKLALSLLGLLVSLSMLAQSARAPKVEPNAEQAAIAKQTKRAFLIVLAVSMAVLVLGMLLYFLPFPR